MRHFFVGTLVFGMLSAGVSLQAETVYEIDEPVALHCQNLFRTTTLVPKSTNQYRVTYYVDHLKVAYDNYTVLSDAPFSDSVSVLIAGEWHNYVDVDMMHWRDILNAVMAEYSGPSLDEIDACTAEDL